MTDGDPRPRTHEQASKELSPGQIRALAGDIIAFLTEVGQEQSNMSAYVMPGESRPTKVMAELDIESIDPLVAHIIVDPKEKILSCHMTYYDPFKRFPDEPTRQPHVEIECRTAVDDSQIERVTKYQLLNLDGSEHANGRRDSTTELNNELPVSDGQAQLFDELLSYDGHGSITRADAAVIRRTMTDYL